MAIGKRRGTTGFSDGKAYKLIEMEAEEEDDEEEEGELVHHKAVVVGDEDEEEDELGQDEYEEDGFVVHDVEEDSEEQQQQQQQQRDEQEKQKKKKKRKSGKSDYVDEDDYELLEEHGIHRRPPKFKRLKKAGKDFDILGHSGLSDEDGSHLEDVAEGEGQEDVDEFEENEMADFIVDEDDEIVVGGASMRPRKSKKKKVRQIAGVSTAALEEARDIFGDVDELLRLRKQSLAPSGRSRDSSELQGKRLEDEFEPFILKEKYLTEKDDSIRKIDMPERIQISEEITKPCLDEESIEEESSWILGQLPSNMIPFWFLKRVTEETNEESKELKYFKADIIRFLKLHHVEKCDIPFIAMYRKEQCLSLLKDPEEVEAENDEGEEIERVPNLKWHKVLWAIKELDTKWLLLQRRKRDLCSYYKLRYKEARRTLNQQLFESILKSIWNAESEREVDDVDMKFNLHFPANEVEGKFKRPKRKSKYSMCYKAGLWEVASKFGWNSEQFGLQITLKEVTREALEDLKETPEEIALNYRCAMFETLEAVLDGARHMAAVEISCEPCLRKYVRSFFMDNAVVSTSPTSTGTKLIDSSHHLATVKWLHEKPLLKFEDAQWLLIQKAEEEKLLQVSITLSKQNLDKLTSQCNDYYLSDGVSKSARLWNEQRKLILQDAFSKFLLPSLEKEARVLLTARAKKWLLMECGKQLWNKVSVAPYQRNEHDSGIDEETAPRIMACCWGSGNPATTFVMLDSSGELLDWMYAGSLSLRSKNVDPQRKKDETQRLLKFMTDHQPHVIVLGAANLSCKRLKDEIYEIIYNMVEEYPRNVSQEMAEISIVYGDESLPRLYEHSRISSEQLPGQPGIVKRAVALGRFLQNPLAMIAALCGSEREILSWNLGSLEHFLTPDERYEMVQQVMVDVTNQVGIDINLAASHDWLFAPLQFISRLGPRKAGSLQRALVRAGAITSRRELIAHGLGTKKVFKNAIGFLRVRCSGSAVSGSDFDVLDDTRIHPESYKLAEALAGEVQKYADNADDDETPIEFVKKNLPLLKGFLAHVYAKDLENSNNKNKYETHYDIKMELLHGFREWRSPFKELSQDEEFYILSGENRDSLVEGKIVQAIVRFVQTDRAICVLDSGLTGILYKTEFADQLDDVDLTDKLQEGHVLTCKIKQIQKNRYRLIITCKESELNISQCQNSCDVDPYYCEHQMHALSQLEKSHRAVVAKKNFIPRMIVHPHFQNITEDEAKEFLSDKDDGQSVICPSSKGPSHLILTLKIYDGVYAQKEIDEDRKDQKASMLRLGTILRIGEESFEDLDEVMDRYVDPLVAYLKAMLNYRKFRRGSKTEVDDLLKVEKSENPLRIVYCFGVCYSHPGAFILSYIRNINPHHEYVVLHPKGFMFRKHTFHNIDQLVAHFQKHINDLLCEPQSIHSASALVPMRSTAYRSLGRAAMGGSKEKNEGNLRGQSCPDRDRLSAPGSQGKNDFINGGSQDRHSSGLPKPSNSNGGKSSGNGSAFQWGSDCTNGSGIDNGWRNFPGAKIQNSPGREAFPGGWSNIQNSSTTNGNWISGGGCKEYKGSDGSGDKSSVGWGDENVTNWSWGIKNIVGRGGGGSANANDAWGGGTSSDSVVKDGKQNGNCLNKNSDTWGGGDWVSGQRGSGVDIGGNWGMVSNDNLGRAGGNAAGKESCSWGEWGGNRSGSSGTKDSGPRNGDWGDKSHGGWGNIDLGGKESGRGTVTSGNECRVSKSWGYNRDGAATNLRSWETGGNNDGKKSGDWGAWGDSRSGNNGAKIGKGDENWVNKKNTGWDGWDGYVGGSKESERGTVTSGNGCKVSDSWVDGRDGAATSLRSWASGANNNDGKKSGDWGEWGDGKSGNSCAKKGKGNDNWGDKKNAGWDGESGSDVGTGNNGGGVSNDGWGDCKGGAATTSGGLGASGENDGKKSGGWGNCKGGAVTRGAWGASGANVDGKKSGSWGDGKGGAAVSSGGWGASGEHDGKKSGSWGDGKGGAAVSSGGWGASGEHDGKKSGGWGDYKGGGAATSGGWGASGKNNGKKSGGWGGCKGGGAATSGGWGASGKNNGKKSGSWGDCKGGSAATSGGWGASVENIDGKKSVDWGNSKGGAASTRGGWGASGDNDGKKSGGWGDCKGGSAATSGGWGASVENIDGKKSVDWGNSKGGAASTSGGWGASGENDGKKSGGWGDCKGGSAATNGGWGASVETIDGKKSGDWGNSKGGAASTNGGWGASGENDGKKSGGRGDYKGGAAATSGGWGASGASIDGKKNGSWGNCKGGAATTSGGWGASGANIDGKKNGSWGDCKGRAAATSGDWGASGENDGKKSGGWGDCKGGVAATSGAWGASVENIDGKKSGGWVDSKGGATPRGAWGAGGENIDGKKIGGWGERGNKNNAGRGGRAWHSAAGTGSEVKNPRWGTRDGNWGNKNNTGLDGSDWGSRQSGTDTSNNGGRVSNNGWGRCKGGAATSGGWGVSGEKDDSKSGGWGELGNKSNTVRSGGAWRSTSGTGSESKNAEGADSGKNSSWK